MNSIRNLAALFVALFIGAAHAQTPLTSAFTYQGELADAGAPVSGAYDIRFRLYDAATGGSQVGSTLCSNDLAINSGRFVTSLDFGTAFDGQRRFLEIEVRRDTGLDCSNATGFTLLAPRQELTAAPNATFAQSAATATTANSATTALSTNNAANLNGQPASFYQNAANLTGTLADARLTSNVARLDGNQTFTGVQNFTNAANDFTGSGAGLTNLNGQRVSAGTLARSSLNADLQSGVGTLVPDLLRAGSVATELFPSDVTVSGSFAYVTASSVAESTLRIFNISNPDAPTLVGSVATGSDPRSVAVSGLFAYVVNTASNTLQVFNISDPESPTLVGSVATGNSPTCVAVSGPRAYVVNTDSNTLQVFSILNPSAPALTGSVATGIQPGSVAVSGSFAYVVSATSNRLQVFNIANPFAPALVGSVVTQSTPIDIAVSGSFAYVVYLNANEMRVFNISNPASPTLAGSVVIWASARSIAVSGSLAFVGGIGADNTLHRLQTFNISNPAAPTLAVTIATEGTPFSVAASGSFAYVANQDPNTMQIFKTPLRVGFSAPLVSTSLSGVNGAGLTDLSASSITTGILPNERTTASSTGFSESIVARDPWGNFSANIITASSFVGSGAALTNLEASDIASGTLANARTTGNIFSSPNTLVLRDGSGNFFAGNITATSFVGSGAALTNLEAGDIASGTLANARTTGTNLSTPNTLVLRDASGNFSAGTITANSFVGSGAALTDLEAGDIASGILANARTTGTNLSAPNTLVLRDGFGNFSAGAISAGSISGNGSGLVNLNAANIALGSLSAARLPIGGNWALASNLNINSNTLVVVPSSDRVGIKTSSPDASVEVNGGTSDGLFVRTASSTPWALRIGNDTATAAGFQTGMSVTNDGLFRVTNRISNPNGPFAQLGDNGVWTSTSDARLKTDVTSAENNLAAALKLRPVNFRWKSDGAEDFGLIAQEVRDVLPKLVTGDETKDSLTVNYSQLSVVAIGAIQELKADNDRKQREIDALRARLERLEEALGTEPVATKP